jgi:hypothetical protein
MMARGELYMLNAYPQQRTLVSIEFLYIQFYVKDLYIFVEGPDDDSNGIETCRPSPVNSILMIVVFD